MKRLMGTVLMAVVLGAFLLLASPALAMALVNVGGWNVTLTPQAEDYIQPSADAGRFVWSDYRTGQGGVITEYDIASGQVVTLLETDLQPVFPILDGDYVVFQGYANNDSQADSGVYLFSLTSKQVRKLSAEGWQGRGPQVSGDVVAWTESQVDDQGLSHTRIVLHRLSTDQTTTLVQTEPGTDQVTLSLVSDQWVLWRNTSQAKKSLDGYSIASGVTNTWEGGGVTPQAMVGDTFYYTVQEGSHWTLRARNLASGADTSLFSNDQQIQSVCVDGGRIAWASTNAQGAFVAISDPLHGGTTVIPSPAYEVGGLSLKGDLLMWRADRLFNSPTIPGTYVFVYDASDKTATRVSAIQSYPHGFASEGKTIAVSESTYRPGFFATDLTIATKGVLDQTKLFSDVPGTDPYWTAIEGLREKGAVSGYPGTGGQAEFRPGGTLTRSQFAKMLVEALGVPLSGDYMTTLVRLGILQGTASGSLDPYGELTRAQMVTLVVRAADQLRPWLLGPISGASTGTLGLFDKTHGPTLAQAEWGGLLDGLVGFAKTWDPWRAASRAETAEVLWNLASASSAHTATPSPTDDLDVPTYVRDDIPGPIVDSAVEGWFII